MKRKLVLLSIAVICGIILYFVGNRYYLKNIYNYERVIKTQLDAYYISEDTTELKEITHLFEVYSFDDSIRSKIQQKSKDIVQDWYTYVNSKYVCDQLNKNTCIIYLNELKSLMTKIIKIRSTNPVEGYTIIDGKDIKLLQDDCESRQKDIKAIIDNKDSTRPKNYDEIRKEKCLKAKECDECKKGICSCTYVNASNRKETIMCTEAEKGANF